MPTIEHAVLKGSIGGTVEIRNIFSAQVTEVGGDTSETLWWTYMTMFLTDICGLLHESVSFYGYDVYQLNAGSWELIDEVPVTFVGTVTGQALLNAASLVLIGKAPGIRHMGRKFFGALGEEQVSGNAMIAGTAATAATCLLDYISPVNGLTGGFLSPGVVDSNGSHWAFVGGVVSNLLGTMRRRKPGIGI